MQTINNPLHLQVNDKAARLLLGKALQILLSDAWGRERLAKQQGGKPENAPAAENTRRGVQDDH